MKNGDELHPILLEAAEIKTLQFGINLVGPETVEPELRRDISEALYRPDYVTFNSPGRTPGVMPLIENDRPELALAPEHFEEVCRVCESVTAIRGLASAIKLNRIKRTASALKEAVNQLVESASPKSAVEFAE